MELSISSMGMENEHNTIGIRKTMNGIWFDARYNCSDSDSRAPFAYLMNEVPSTLYLISIVRWDISRSEWEANLDGEVDRELHQGEMHEVELKNTFSLCRSKIIDMKLQELGHVIGLIDLASKEKRKEIFILYFQPSSTLKK